MISPRYTLLAILSMVNCDPFNNVKIEYVSHETYHLAEAPFWSPIYDQLFFVDTFAGNVHRLNVTNGQTQRIFMEDYVSLIIPIAGLFNRFLVSRRNQLLDLDWTTASYRQLKFMGPEKFNEGKVDAMGRLWIGTLRNLDPNTNDVALRHGGGLYRLDGINLFKVDMYSLPNGMAWSLDSKKFFVSDTNERLINEYDYDLSTGAIANKRVLLNFTNNPAFKKSEVPDGLAVDRHGKLWVAILFGARIIRLDPKDGKVEGWIQTPANQTTSLTFGGPDYREMYVTTGWRGMSDTERLLHPNVGKVLRITADFIRGTGSETPFRLV